MSNSSKRISKDKQIYDLTQMLEVSKSLCSVFEYSTLIESILYICMCQMRVLSAGMYIQATYDSDTFDLSDNYSGFEIAPNREYSISITDPIVNYLKLLDGPKTMNQMKHDLGNKVDCSQLESLQPSLIVPLKQKTRLVGFMLLGERIDLGEGLEYTKYDKEQILTLASLSAVAINNALMVEQTTTDMMTKLKLRHYFFAVLSENMEKCRLAGMPISVLMLDIDDFKRFNDTWGHQCGDFVLQETASAISECIRTRDLAGRYGGEEFIVMLHDTDAREAEKVAERIREKVESQILNYEGQTMNVTVSIGVATMMDKISDTPKTITQCSDEAMYQSKKNGKNRVTVYRKYR